MLRVRVGGVLRTRRTDTGYRRELLREPVRWIDL